MRLPWIQQLTTPFYTSRMTAWYINYIYRFWKNSSPDNVKEWTLVTLVHLIHNILNWLRFFWCIVLKCFYCIMLIVFLIYQLFSDYLLKHFDFDIKKKRFMITTKTLMQEDELSAFSCCVEDSMCWIGKD